jgi:hypothetical protein
MINLSKKIKGIKYTLTKKQPRGYDIFTTAKNSGQNLPSELQKIRGCVFTDYGFFYARKMLRVMTDCVEELSGSPFPFVAVRQILYSLSPFQFALKMTVSQLQKETA